MTTMGMTKLETTTTHNKSPNCESLMNIALSAGGLLTKYLNKIFVVSREVVSDGVVTVAQDYSQLGDLLWVVVVSSFVIPIVVIIKFNPTPHD
jgi:uncharacterized protein Smg (DUF494 family)